MADLEPLPHKHSWRTHCTKPGHCPWRRCVQCGAVQNLDNGRIISGPTPMTDEGAK